ncbi:hypothetical protein VTK26DRAFT_6704 [Humicola hyalothermophila]
MNRVDASPLFPDLINWGSGPNQLLRDLEERSRVKQATEQEMYSEWLHTFAFARLEFPIERDRHRQGQRTFQAPFSRQLMNRLPLQEGLGSDSHIIGKSATKKGDTGLTDIQ